MSREHYTSFGKILILILLSLILSMPLTAHASKKTLVLFPLAIYADKPLDHIRKGVASMLSSRLSAEGIEVISVEKIESLLQEKGQEVITSRKRAEELARRVKAEYAIFGSITAIGAGYSLDLSLLELGKKESQLTRVSTAVDEDQFIPQLSDVAYQLRAAIEGKEIATKEMAKPPAMFPKTKPTTGIFSQLEQEKQEPAAVEKGLLFEPTRESQAFKPTGQISVDMEVMAFDIGDLNGDGKIELVIVDRKKLLVYQREEKSFVLNDILKASWGEEFFKVSVGDIDNNGTAEIYVVSCYGMRARSTVFERTGEFKRLNRQTGHLRVVKDSNGRRSLLLFQGSKVDEFFSGSIYVMNYNKEGKLAKIKQLPKLGGVQFYTLGLFDLDRSGDPEWLGLGEESRFLVWDKQGKLLWRGDKKLGGTNNAIRLGDAAPGDLPPRISFNSRLLITDIDGDGNKEIVAIKNIPLIEHMVNFKVFTKSRLIAYRIEGTSLVPAWTTRDIEYCLTDMKAAGQSLFLAAHKGKISNIGKKSGLIMWFGNYSATDSHR